MDINVINAILSKKEDFLRRHLVLSASVIDKLREMDVIGRYTKNQMMDSRTDAEKQITLLLACLRTRGQPAFQGFLNVLRMTFHGWLADDILNSSIEIGDSQTTTVRDIINRMYQTKLHDEQFRYKTVCLTDSEYMYMYVPYFLKGPRCQLEPQEGQYVDDGRRHSDEMKIRHEYTSEGYSPWRRKTSTSDQDTCKVSLIEQISKNLRDLQKVFDNEWSVTLTSLATLKQEELTIKALLQHNLRDQQALLTRQHGLREMKGNMEELNKTATQICKPEPDVHVTRRRLNYLQRIPWTRKK